LPRAGRRATLSRVPPAAVPVLAMPTEVTLENLPDLQKQADALVGETARGLVVDLGKTMFMSSSGLGMLVKTGMKLRERGGSIALARPMPVIQRLLFAVGLDAVLPAFPTMAEATAHAERGAARPAS
jgi:anti-anti-sigma factor